MNKRTPRDAREDLKRSRQRMGKFLLRKERRYTVGKSAWTIAHRKWLLLSLRLFPRGETVFYPPCRLVKSHILGSGGSIRISEESGISISNRIVSLKPVLAIDIAA